MKAGILTVSDKGSRQEREDRSGPVVRDLLCAAGFSIEKYEIIPDEKDMITQKLLEYTEQDHLDLIVTTGGTGVAPRDVTPEATRAVMEREVPGMAEAMRMESFRKTPHAVLSRAMAAIRGKTLIINLPGSPKAASENLTTVLDAIPHAIAKIKGDTTECAV
jgi:molybdenum cofactor synthesis domain-containing protein